MPCPELFVNDQYGFLIAPPALGTYNIVVASGTQVLMTYRITVQPPHNIAQE